MPVALYHTQQVEPTFRLFHFRKCISPNRIRHAARFKGQKLGIFQGVAAKSENGGGAVNKTLQRSLLFRQNVNRTEEEWVHFLHCLFAKRRARCDDWREGCSKSNRARRPRCHRPSGRGRGTYHRRPAHPPADQQANRLTNSPPPSLNLCLFFEGTGRGVAGKITNVTRLRDLCVDDARQMCRTARLSQKLDATAVVLHDPHGESFNLWGAFDRVRRNLPRIRLHFACKGL